ncbi:MAG TPA: exo-beta-N-acetylmuramidase NamZ domain-containing protein, partial [Thermoanaerobaculia bacterium]|nr:exo-beta-N-acetylmuramidase NamZ domain-containing protein [Thermoanaerobaculia bacterium]
FPAQMTEILSPPEVAIRRAGGFDVDSAYSRPRGERFPIGASFGHTGWTGGFLWIVPQARTFYVFLSNRVHPDGRGSVIALQKRLGTLVAESLAGLSFDRQPQRVGWVTGGADAQNGIDVLHANGYDALRGMRVGLITNHTGIDRAGNPTIDLLRSAPGVTLVALFSPEHGIAGTADEKVADSAREIPIYSLYGERRRPSPEQLANLDALVFDIQDIGTRFYTYISTMGLAMEAAAEAKVKFVVLDRVNPIGGAMVEGPLLEGETNFVGWHTLPVRHGMTVGELARMFREERGIDVDLTVVPLRGWVREHWQDEAGLPWIDTSPNMRSLSAAALYPGLGLLERALSVGRGTGTPFEILGAPYIDGPQLARALRGLPGLWFEPVRFTPAVSIHKGEECGGVRVFITNRSALRSVDAGVVIAATLARLYPDQFPVDELRPLLRHEATLQAIRAGTPIERIRATWGTNAFIERRAKYLLY